jgi:putative YphP/YqiW family bacilliredoxin
MWRVVKGARGTFSSICTTKRLKATAVLRTVLDRFAVTSVERFACGVGRSVERFACGVGRMEMAEMPRGTTNMYPEIMVIPMREELTRAGVGEARTAADVDAAIAQAGTTMLVVNSICGCAAGKMRPGVRLAMQHTTKPDHAVTVFAGQDRDATEKARSYFGGHPPTSPAIAILRDGQLVYLMQRSAIETSTAPAIAQELARAFDTYCAKTTA